MIKIIYKKIRNIILYHKLLTYIYYINDYYLETPSSTDKMHAKEIFSSTQIYNLFIKIKSFILPSIEGYTALILKEDRDVVNLIFEDIRKDYIPEPILDIFRSYSYNFLNFNFLDYENIKPIDRNIPGVEDFPEIEFGPELKRKIKNNKNLI